MESEEDSQNGPTKEDSTITNNDRNEPPPFDDGRLNRYPPFHPGRGRGFPRGMRYNAVIL